MDLGPRRLGSPRLRGGPGWSADSLAEDLRNPGDPRLGEALEPRTAASVLTLVAKAERILRTLAATLGEHTNPMETTTMGIGLPSYAHGASLWDGRPEPPPNAPNPFRRTGDFWTLGLDGRVFHLKHSRGLAFLAHLLCHAGQLVHVLELEAAVPACEHAPGTLDGGRTDRGDAGEILDVTARQAYRRRLGELREEREEATSQNDIGRTARLEAEIEFLSAELRAAVGLGGRARRSGVAVERARVNVTRQIGLARQRIARHDPALGWYLDATVRTGAWCSFTPDPRHPVEWIL